jgi:hypothetical protein
LHNGQPQPAWTVTIGENSQSPNRIPGAGFCERQLQTADPMRRCCVELGQPVLCPAVAAVLGLLENADIHAVSPPDVERWSTAFVKALPHV